MPLTRRGVSLVVANSQKPCNQTFACLSCWSHQYYRFWLRKPTTSPGKVNCMVLDWEGQNPKRKTYIGHLKYWGYKLQGINIEIDKNDKIQDIIWHKLNSISIEIFNNITLPLQSQLNIYIDGSKTKHHVGAGYSTIKDNVTILEGSKRLPDESSVFFL